jgi:hypothetical protein
MSSVVALTKSLSPAGKKLTPMLAIAIQGLLFSFGTLLVGINIMGLMIGAILSSLWAFLQPVIIFTFLLGHKFWDALFFTWQKISSFANLNQNAWKFFLVMAIGFKVILAIATVVLAIRMPESIILKYQEKLLKWSHVRRPRATPLIAPLKAALNDFLNPLFLISAALTGIYVFYWESDLEEKVIGILRPFCLGFLFFYVVRLAAARLTWDDLKKHPFTRSLATTMKKYLKN